jgi:hypothetical protein
VQKITGPVMTLMSCRKVSASHLVLRATPGANRPSRMPATMAIRIQNHSFE